MTTYEPGNDHGVLGSSFAAAVFSGDTDMIVAYRAAFTDAELLDALTQGTAAPLLVLGRRVAHQEGKSLQSLGDTLVGAARLALKAGYRSA